MSLSVEVRVNKELISVIEATRMTGMVTDTPPDKVNTYRVVHWTPTEGITLVADIQHRYGDGAHILAQKAMEATR